MVKSALPLIMEDVSVKKHGNIIIGPISCKLEINGFTVVMGPNGSGKTSLLRLMHGLETPRQGTISWNIAISEARNAQAFVFQNPTMLRRNVIDNIAYPLLLKGEEKSKARSKAELWADKVGISNVKHLNAQVLSGGEKQKLAIARALITEPQILFLDEPTANLDGQSIREIELILKTVFDVGTRIVMATHDLVQAKRLGTDVLFLYRGKLHEQSSMSTFLNTPHSKETAAFIAGDIVE